MPRHVDPNGILRRRARYFFHRQMLKAAGHDPDFIGTTEAKPVCCAKCGEPIPWKTLRGWQD